MNKPRTKKQLHANPGDKFNRLTVLELVYFAYPFWERFVDVKCDCGTERMIRLRALVRNRIKSCGCLRAEMIEKTRKQKGERT